MKPINKSVLHRLPSWLTVAACCALLLQSHPALAQTAQEGKWIGALSAEDLHKKRAPAPVDLTGTYNFDRGSSPMTAYLFTPSPPLTPAAQAVLNKYKYWTAKGYAYRDDSAACWPLGMPMIMTRYWPIQVIQLPTEVVLISMFDNNVRWIYTDGRPHPADADAVYSYNGHSIGHWEGKTLVVDTVDLTDDHHWIQPGIPSGTHLHIVERISLSPDRKILEDQFSMTDPDNWIGVWKSTKHWIRDDKADIEEHTCIYEEESQLPGFNRNIRQ